MASTMGNINKAARELKTNKTSTATKILTIKARQLMPFLDSCFASLIFSCFDFFKTQNSKVSWTGSPACIKSQSSFVKKARYAKNEKIIIKIKNLPTKVSKKIPKLWTKATVKNTIMNEIKYMNEIQDKLYNKIMYDKNQVQLDYEERAAEWWKYRKLRKNTVLKSLSNHS